MARPTADTSQVTFRVPTHWLAQADAVAAILSRHGMIATRTDVFREAIARGMAEIVKDEGRTQYRVSAWDGRSTTCLFWFGPEERDAIDAANQLAKESRAAKGSKDPKVAAMARWTIFRVYKGDDEVPIYDVMPGASVADGIRKRTDALAKHADRKPSKK